MVLPCSPSVDLHYILPAAASCVRGSWCFLDVVISSLSVVFVVSCTCGSSQKTAAVSSSFFAAAAASGTHMWIASLVSSFFSPSSKVAAAARFLQVFFPMPYTLLQAPRWVPPDPDCCPLGS